ncbi:hypothetical protein, partial [Escherichia coli]|uniref:hypothetical protein n=1 Tax=Escherichia coli TaxID=562 RepID=UPI001955318F
VLSLRIPAALKTKLEAQAAQKNMSLSDYVRDRLTASDGEKNFAGSPARPVRARTAGGKSAQASGD